MGSLRRPPTPGLRPFVRLLWAVDQPSVAPGRELVVPSGLMHLAVRIGGPPLTLLPEASSGGTGAVVVGHAVIGGARGSPYLRAIGGSSCSVGAQLVPGAGALLLGATGASLAGAHTRLEDLWGRAEVERLRDRLQAAPSLVERLALFEAMLVARAASARRVHPAIAASVVELARGATVGEVVERAGYSHRALIHLFHEAVGLTPKTFSRVLRVQRAITALARGSSLAGDALEAGYADQPHLTREFSEIVGLPPRRYLTASPSASNHVPIEEAQPGKIPSRRRAPAAQGFALRGEP